MRIFIVSIMIIVFSSCSSFQQKNELQKINLSGNTQGTYYAITLYADVDTSIICNGIDSLLEYMDKTASLYNDSSLICQINRNDSNIELNDLFIKIFNRSMEISQETQGAFDITVGNLVRAWGFAREKGQEPNEQALDSLIELTGYSKIALINNHIQKERPNISIDLNAIAQGCTSDLIAEYFISKGIKNFLIDVGGEVRASGQKPDGTAWVIGIEKPESAISEREIQQKVSIGDLSIATSGSYRKFIVKDGIVYSHTIDPISGYPTHSQLLSVSVIAKTCMDADAYATAFMVMGLKRSLIFLKSHPELQAYFISADKNGSFEITYTEGFTKFMK